MPVYDVVLNAWHKPQVEAVAHRGNLVKEPFRPCPFAKESEHHEAQNIADAQLCQPEGAAVPCPCQCPKCQGAFAVMSAALGNPVKEEWWYEICHQHHAEHTDDGDLCQREECRMFGYYQRPYADEHYEGREDDAVLV